MPRLHSRREFLQYAGGALALTALGGPLLAACNSTIAARASSPTIAPGPAAVTLPTRTAGLPLKEC